MIRSGNEKDGSTRGCGVQEEKQTHIFIYN